jgi:CheY-like chemotaxis protein
MMNSLGTEIASESILLVDDDLEILESMSELLGKRGYVIVQAVNGQKALDLLRKIRALPLLIVLDMSMPVLNGREFLRERERDADLGDSRNCGVCRARARYSGGFRCLSAETSNN